MNAPRILDILKRTTWTHVKPSLGRWNIHNQGQTSLKVKFANEDNCGMSGRREKKDDTDDNQLIYSMGFESVHTKIELIYY
jgi:hypothetical protein